MLIILKKFQYNNVVYLKGQQLELYDFGPLWQIRINGQDVDVVFKNTIVDWLKQGKVKKL